MAGRLVAVGDVEPDSRRSRTTTARSSITVGATAGATASKVVGPSSGTRPRPARCCPPWASSAPTSSGSPTAAPSRCSWLEWLPHADDVQIPGAGHALERTHVPEVASAIRAFLRRHRPRHRHGHRRRGIGNRRRRGCRRQCGDPSRESRAVRHRCGLADGGGRYGDGGADPGQQRGQREHRVPGDRAVRGPGRGRARRNRTGVLRP